MCGLTIFQFSLARPEDRACIPSSASTAFFLSAWSFGRIETERVPTGTARLVGHMDPPRGHYDGTAYLRLPADISVGCHEGGGENIRDPAESFYGCYRILHYHLRAVEDVKSAFRLRARP